MWSLQKLLVPLCIALSHVTSAAGLIRVSGYEGREAKVPCAYGNGYESYEKYLCRNDCGDGDVLIMTSEGKKNRYSIYDDKNTRVFTATISGLSSADVGKYWCGVTRTGKDLYTEVKLDVKPDSCCDNVIQVQGYEDDSVSISCPYESKDTNNLKYICRGHQPSTCLQQAVVTSNTKQNEQFSLNDSTSGNFTVTITGLTLNNSGSYLCGVHRNTGLDVFSGVELEVKEWCCVKSHNLRGIARLPVTMKCPYSPQHGTNMKFLCKGDHRNKCTNMVTSQGSSDQRFTLRDHADSSSFLVTVTELEAGDAGTYWCGSDPQWSVGNYIKIQLSVEETSTVISTSIVEHVTSQITQISDRPMKDAANIHTDAVNFHTVVIIVPAVLLTLTFVVITIIVYKYKCYKVHGSNMNGNIKTAETKAEVEMSDAEIYENQEVVKSSKQRTWQQNTQRRNDEEADKDQQDCVYQNFESTDNIYCNQV